MFVSELISELNKFREDGGEIITPQKVTKIFLRNLIEHGIPPETKPHTYEEMSDRMVRQEYFLIRLFTRQAMEFACLPLMYSTEHRKKLSNDLIDVISLIRYEDHKPFKDEE